MGELPLVVSHYTVDTGYEAEVRNLITSLETLDLDYYVEPMKSLGTWRANSNYCSKLVMNALNDNPGRNVLRVDADAVFKQAPTLLAEDAFTADVAAHVHDFPWHQRELLGGTIFFRNTPEVRRLVCEWVRCSTVTQSRLRNPDLLQVLLKSDKYAVQFAELPDTYCKIFDLMADVRDPVIEHYQASRRFKSQVNHAGVRR